MARILAAVLVLCAVVAGGGFEYRYHGRIYPHVRAGSVDVGGLTRNEAEARLSPYSVRQRFRAIGLRAPGHQPILVQAYTLGYSVDGGLTAWRAYQAGRDGSPPRRVAAQFGILVRGTGIPIVQRVDRGALRAYLFSLARGLDRPARRGVPGRRLDVARAARSIARLLLHTGAFSVDLPFTVVAPPRARRSARHTAAHASTRVGARRHAATH